ncbi:MAG TPA: TlpA disulfide reductase family protein [Candidatus Kryptonia bacterium]
MRKMIWIVFLSLISSWYSFSQTVVTGRILGGDGKPMREARLFVARPLEPLSGAGMQARTDGSFRIDIRSKGVWMLNFTGTYHDVFALPLYVDKKRSVKLNVRLATHRYLAHLGQVKITGNFNRWYPPDAVTMSLQPDGSYSAVIDNESDTVIYRVVGVSPAREVEGTEADGYISNGVAGFSSFLISKKGMITITFDPRKLVTSNQEANFNFAPTDSFDSRFAKIYLETQRDKIEWAHAQLEAIEKKRSGPVFNTDSALASLQSQLMNETNHLLRQEIYLEYFVLKSLRHYADSSTCRKTVSEIPPSSYIWGLDPGAISDAFDHVGYNDNEARRGQYVDMVLTSNPVEKTKSILLSNEFKRKLYQGADEKALRYYCILTDQYGNTPEAEELQRVFYHMSSIQIGKPVPRFNVVDMIDSMTISNDSPKGRYLLMNFWSTTSRASIDEIKNLQGAYGRYMKKNLLIISLSADSSAGVVLKFLHSTKMPWANVFIYDGINGKLFRDFNAYSLPKNILVGPDGNVIAMGMELRGSDLEKTLSKWLENRK